MTENDLAQSVQKASFLLRQSTHAVVISGAGISTPSGIPDFRSAKQGLWTRSDPMKVASLSAFHNRPEVFFDWLRPLATQIWQATPNPAHLALAQMEQAGLIKAIITQNIDGLHQAAGSQNVIEVHGTLTHLTCPDCQIRYPQTQFAQDFVQNIKNPACPACQRWLKPDIVLFEELLPVQAWEKAVENVQKADFLLVAGSSLEVMPVAGLPVYAVDNQAKIVMANFSETYLDDEASVCLPFDLAQSLPLLAKAALR